MAQVIRPVSTPSSSMKASSFRLSFHAFSSSIKLSFSSSVPSIRIELRKLRGLSQKEFAETIGISQRSVSWGGNSRGTMFLITQSKISVCLSVSMKISSFLPFVYRYFHDFSTDSITGNDKVFRFSYFQTNALYKPERMIFQFLPAEILSAIQFYNLPDTFQPKTAFIFFLFCTFHFRICL